MVDLYHFKQLCKLQRSRSASLFPKILSFINKLGFLS